MIFLFFRKTSDRKFKEREKNKLLEEKINKIKEEFLENDLLLRVDLISVEELRLCVNSL